MARNGKNGKEFRLIKIEELDVNEESEIRPIDREYVEVLAESIKNTGLLQPIRCYRNGQKYRVTAGRHRVLAAKKAGLKEVPAIILQRGSRKRELLDTLIENYFQKGLDQREFLRVVRALVEDEGMSPGEIRAQTGVPKVALWRAMKVLSMPEEVRKYYEEERAPLWIVDYTHKLPPEYHAEILDAVANGKLSPTSVPEVARKILVRLEQQKKAEEEEAGSPERAPAEAEEKPVETTTTREVPVGTGEPEAKEEAKVERPQEVTIETKAPVQYRCDFCGKLITAHQVLTLRYCIAHQIIREQLRSLPVDIYSELEKRGITGDEANWKAYKVLQKIRSMLPQMVEEVLRE
mgnify:CR=1 FL=1